MGLNQKRATSTSFKPGKSGNPEGGRIRPKKVEPLEGAEELGAKEVMQRARKYTAEALEAVVAIIRDEGLGERVRLDAAKTLLWIAGVDPSKVDDPTLKQYAPKVVIQWNDPTTTTPEIEASASDSTPTSGDSEPFLKPSSGGTDDLPH